MQVIFKYKNKYIIFLINTLNILIDLKKLYINLKGNTSRRHICFLRCRDIYDRRKQDIFS